jgi:microcystin-dependent protein
MSLESRITALAEAIANEINAMRESLVPVGTLLTFAGYAPPLGYEWCDGRALIATNYKALAATIGGMHGVSNGLGFTASISGGVITTGAHLLSVGDIVFLSGGLTITPSPGMSVAGTPLHVYEIVSATQFRVSQFAGGVTPLSGSGSGHSVFRSFAVPDLRGRVLAGRDDQGGSAAGRLTNASSGFGVSASLLGAVGGSQSHTLSIAEMPAHTHTTPTDDGNNNATNGTAARASNTNGVTGSAGGGAAHPNVQPTAICNIIIRSSG